MDDDGIIFLYWHSSRLLTRYRKCSSGNSLDCVLYWGNRVSNSSHQSVGNMEINSVNSKQWAGLPVLSGGALHQIEARKSSVQKRDISVFYLASVSFMMVRHSPFIDNRIQFKLLSQLQLSSFTKDFYMLKQILSLLLYSFMLDIGSVDFNLICLLKRNT